MTMRHTRDYSLESLAKMAENDTFEALSTESLFDFFRRRAIKASDIEHLQKLQGAASAALKVASTHTKEGKLYSHLHNSKRLRRYPVRGGRLLPNIVQGLGQEITSIRTLTQVLEQLSTDFTNLDDAQIKQAQSRVAQLEFLNGISVNAKNEAGGVKARDDAHNRITDRRIEVGSDTGTSSDVSRFVIGKIVPFGGIIGAWRDMRNVNHINEQNKTSGQKFAQDWRPVLQVCAQAITALTAFFKVAQAHRDSNPDSKARARFTQVQSYAFLLEEVVKANLEFIEQVAKGLS